MLRRRYRIPVLIIIAGSLYLCFQLFSYKVLNLRASPRRHSGILTGEIGSNHKQGLKNMVPVPVQQGNVPRIALKVDNSLGESQFGGPSQRVRGVHSYMEPHYRPRVDSMFQCIRSKELIPYSQVNDDYCDCGDSTDEPGTSACPDSKFYCLFQYPDQEPQYIFGSRVNDGVCDCCDGSDEWAGITVFSGVHMTLERLKTSLSHAPCNNSCLELQKLIAEDDRIRELGKRLQLKYIEAGKQATDNKLYGPDSVFYQLAQGCFEYETSEYKYTVCPFKSVSQQHFPDPTVNLGRKPVWASILKDYHVYKLRMDGGDIRGCPKQRRTEITFICGLNDRVLKISEDEKCSYGVKFSTPAAC